MLELRQRVRPYGAAPFPAPAERGARTAAGGFGPNGRLLFLHRLSGVLELRQRVRPNGAESFSLNLSGECAYPAGAQEGRHLRFPPSCESPLSLEGLAQIAYM